MKTWAVRMGVVCLASACACGSGARGNGGGNADGRGTVTAAAGGTVSLAGGPTLVVPPGAVASDLAITIARAAASAANGSPLYEFGPAGTAFSKPVAVTLPLPSGASTGSVYWSKPGSTTAFDSLGGAVVSGAITAATSHFSVAFVGAACSAGAACTAASACHLGALDCSGGAPVCIDSGASAQDGTACGAGSVCSAGVCGGQITTRTVTGIAQVTFWPDDGIKRTVRAPNPRGFVPAALWVPSGTPSAWTKVPLAPAVDGSFTVSDVPTGHYFLQVETSFFSPAAGGGQVRAISAALTELTTSTPDLTVYTSARPDLARTTVATPVSLAISGATPFGADLDDLILNSSQAAVVARPLGAGVARPAAGATSLSGTFDWFAGAEFSGAGVPLPNAAKGDVVYVTHRLSEAVGTGTATGEFRRVVDAVRLTDFTLEGVASPTLTVAFPQPAPAPTGQLPHDLRLSQFAALAPGLNPAAVLDPVFGVAVAAFASPHSITYPDWPSDGEARFGFVQAPGLATDVDYGPLPYVQFLDPSWKEWLQIIATYSVGSYLAFEAGGGPVAPLEPVIGPVRDPLLNGGDAFVSRIVAEPVTLSWTAPALGTPTSYAVGVSLVPQGPQDFPVDGETTAISATLYSGTSFTVPPGFFKAGRTYQASVTAIRGPGWDQLDRALFASGTPFASMDCVTATFKL